MNAKLKYLLVASAIMCLCATTTIAAQKKQLGQSCKSGGNAVCISGACDAGWGTSGTNTCVPKNGKGSDGDHCTSDGHCKSGKCSGLRKQSNGRWKPGKCSGKKDLGKSCGNNSECKSNFCDRGMGSVGTSTCVPPAGKGSEGDHCTSNGHCRSNICGGLKALGGGRWKAGTCHSGAVEVSGTVYNDKNKPASDLTVKVWDVNPGQDTNVLLGSGSTDSKGNFKVTGRFYQDQGDMLGNGKQPDVRVTFEVTPEYTYPVSLGEDCWKETSWEKFCWRDIDQYLIKKGEVLSNAHYTQDKITYWKSNYSKIVRDVGKVARIGIWPAHNKQLDNHDPSKPIVIPRGMVTVPENKWEMVRTNFDPRRHGFGFVNVARNVCWGPTCKPPWHEIFRTSQALCGGFSLTAFKNYMNKECDTFTKYKSIEKDGENVLPADLKKTLVQNQMETFFFHEYQDKGFDLGKGFDIRGLKFLEWQAKQDEPDQQAGNTIGVSTKAEWPKIRYELKNRNLPVVIGQVKFKAAAHNLLDIDGLTNNHQVLAIGYDYNPYYGSVTLYVYDPNHPGKVSEIRFNENLFHSKMFIDYFHGNMKTYPLRGFFLMTKAPPGKKAPPACK